MNSKVSVIVPVYKVEKYLAHCIESLIEQSFKEIELILVDDGSPDNSGNICEEYAKIDERIKVIHKENGGLADARNAGIKVATSDLLLFIDSDDWCELNMIEQLYKRYVETEADIITFGYVIDYINNDFSLKKSLDSNLFFKGKEAVRKAIYMLDEKEMFNSVCNKMYKKEILDNKEISFRLDGMPGEDLIFNCSYFTNINSIAFFDGEFYHYMRRDEATLVTRYEKDMYKKVANFNLIRKNMYDFYNMNTMEEKICYAKTFNSYTSSYVNNLYRKKSSLSFQERTTLIKQLMCNYEIKYYMQLDNSKNIYEKIFRKLYGLNNAFIFNSCYTTLFFMRNNFDSIYRSFRKYILIDSRGG